VKRHSIRLKRVYERPSASDGMRVLVDRLWPRGLTKQAVSADLWLKNAAPSTVLRQWFGHDPDRWAGFSRRYRIELERQPEVLELIDDLRRSAPVTLIYGARDEVHNHAVILQKVLEHRSPARPRRKTS
jgi:uncharacterized protein YeaO (DUF488 family)